MIIFHLPEGYSLDTVILGESLTSNQRVEMAWQVLRLACEAAGVRVPLNPLTQKLEVALASAIFHFFNNFTEPYNRKIDFIKMVRHAIADYNAECGTTYNGGLRKAKEFTDNIFASTPFTKHSTEANIAAYLRLMNFEKFFKA